MSDASTLIETKCDQIASQNAALRPVVQKLKSDGQTLSLDELLQFQVGDNLYLLTFKYLLVFIRYRAEVPRGVNYAVMSDHYLYVLSNIPQDCKAVVGNFITDMYYSALAKEIETNKIEELKIWIGVYGKLKQHNIDIQAFDDSLAIRLSDYIWNNIEDDNLNISNYTQIVKLVILAQNNGLDVNDTSLIISTISTYLNLKYDVFSGVQNRNEREISLLIGQLKLLKPSSESDAQLVKSLEDYFGSLVEQENVSGSSNKVFVKDPNLVYKPINFQQIVFRKTIFVNVKHPSFKVNIHHYTCPQNGEIALKVYEKKDPNYDMRRIINEIDILETLSRLSDPNNCFLKYVGSYMESDKAYLAMEYHEYSLMDIITLMKKQGRRFSEGELVQHATDLISAFYTMHQMGIFHQDIKPHNMLMTSNGKLKIIDFSVSESKSYDENTVSPTGLHPIQGTHGYMAPEIQKHALNDNREKVRFKLNKADVFSLGITLLQMYCLEELQTLNFEENNNKLMAKVDQIGYAWLSTLLKGMLMLKHRERLSLKKCLRILPASKTMTYQQP